MNPTGPEPLVIGVDLGTSSCKSTAYDLSGNVVGRARRTYATHSTDDGAVTQRPDEWLTAVTDSLAELAAGIGSRDLLGIGLSGQIGTHVLLDDTGAPLGDAVTWQDGRSAAVLDQLWHTVDRVALARQLDTWLPSGAAWPLTRLLWLRQTRPADLDAARHLAQPKDLVCRHLTGRLVSDPSSWRGIARPDGSIVHTALAALELPDVFPEIAPGFEVAGTLTAAIAELTGCPKSTPVYIGWNDLNASLLGIGATSPGDAFDIGGTSEHLGFVSTASADGFKINSVPHHGVSTGQYTLYGVSSNGGGVVEWLNATILAGAGESRLDELVQTTRPGADNLLFLPYLRGERAPVWDADATGAYVGLRALHNTGSLARAALEGVAFNLRQIRDSLPRHEILGKIRATGGTAQLAVWNKIKADVLQRPIATMRESDSSSLGAAMTAALGAGAFRDSAAAANAMVHEASVVEPNRAVGDIYDEIYELYLRLHPALANISHRLTSKGRHD